MEHSYFSRQVLGCVMTVVVLISSVSLTSAGQIATYWGQSGNDNDEGTLAALCNSNNYEIVMIAFLSKFGGGRTPVLNLAGHCDPPSGSCRRYASDIQTCQSKKIKVLLSLGGGEPGYGFNSADEARQLAQHIWNNYMGGSNSNSPLGAAKLDGIDLDIESGSALYYANLGGRLREIAQNNGYKTLYFGAAPQCPFPDESLGPAAGKFLSANLVDYVFVQFYNNPGCDIRGGVSAVVNSWRTWTSKIPNRPQIYLGLPASTSAGGGYMTTSVLINNVLPQIKTIGKYGGVMLWAPTTDRSYASTIKSHV